MRLRTVSPNDVGWTRRRAGNGFVYLDHAGHRLPPEAVQRVKTLVIPPAWQQVWICPAPNGHVQVVGTDAAGRRQYIYHPEWRRKRDEAKFDRILTMAKALPHARLRIFADLDNDGLGKERVLALAVRLIDVGYFRIGSDVYADEHGSYGLTTLERRHVRRQRDALLFSFVGKSGIEHEILVDDGDIFDVVQQLRRRSGGGDRLLAYRDGRRWSPVQAGDVNAYLQEIFDAEVTAKDFRTWHATVIAAASLADNAVGDTSRTVRKRAVRQAVVEVSEYLGNTPTIARNSYIDPRVIDLYEDGTTIAHALQRTPEQPLQRQEHLEKAVLRMLSRAPTSAQRSSRVRTVAR
ncbi:MAG: DNA topoisomerase IB [Propionibacteriales bacterium]|nr:DNA topoisomerase IB [Propionibacteriales bacterium]